MPNVAKFRKTLKAHGLESDICNAIDAGYEHVSDTSKRQEKRDFFAHALTVMDGMVGGETVTALMNENRCCCAGTAREKASRAFAKEHLGKSIEERIPLIGNVPHMGKPSLTADFKLHILAVQYQRDGKYRCACPNINTGKEKETPVPRSYCKCCAGHFRFHYQIMLGCKMQLESVYASPLDTDGGEPCGFIFSILR